MGSDDAGDPGSQYRPSIPGSSAVLGEIERSHLPERMQKAPARRGGLTLMETAERDAIVDAMERASGNKL